MRLLVLLAAGVLVGSVMAEDRKAPAKDEKKVKDEEAILGTWKVEKVDTGTTNGPKAEEFEKKRYIFQKGGRVTAISPSGEVGAGEYKLDPSASPKTLDLIQTDPKDGTLCLYELDGDTLNLCYTFGDESSRPREFKADGKKVRVMTFTRVKDEPKKDEKKQAEAEWAKQVVVDFLKAIQAQQYTQAHRLLTTETAKEYVKRVADAPSPLDNGRFAGWEFDADKVSPDKDEVVVRGQIKGKIEKTDYTSAFTVRVVKERGEGRWRIDYFLFEKCQEVPVRK